MNNETNAAASLAPTDALDAYTKLSPDEVQEIRRLMEVTRQNNSREFELPVLPITEQDKDKFADALVTGKPYSESFERFGGKFKVTLRTQFKWEEDDVVEQIFKDFEDKHTKTQGQYANRLNVYKLCYQVQSMDGVPAISPKKKQNLREYVENSIFENITEPKLYVLISLLTQFDTKVTSLCRLALPDFSSPDADS